MYLLDTDVISNLFKRAPSTALIKKLVAIPPNHQFTSSITLGELVYGACRVPERSSRLLAQLDDLLPANLPVLPFDELAARQYGEIRGELERRGTPIGQADLQIGAIALSRGLTVVTGNVKHYQQIPELSVENWLR